MRKRSAAVVLALTVATCSQQETPQERWDDETHTIKPPATSSSPPVGSWYWNWMMLRHAAEPTRTVDRPAPYIPRYKTPPPNRPFVVSVRPRPGFTSSPKPTSVPVVSRGGFGYTSVSTSSGG